MEYNPSCAKCRDEAGKNRSGIIDSSLCVPHLRSRIAELEAERDRLRNAIIKAIKIHWDIQLLSSDQCEAIDGLEDALRREGSDG